MFFSFGKEQGAVEAKIKDRAEIGNIYQLGLFLQQLCLDATRTKTLI